VDPIPLTSRSYLLKSLGFNDLALKQSKEALKIMPDNSLAFEYLGEIYKIKGDYRRSFENLRLAVMLDSQDKNLRLALAEAYEHLKDYSGAKLQYERILELNPKSSKAYFGLAKIAALTDQTLKANEYLAKAQKLDPKDKVAVDKIRDIIDKNKKPKIAPGVK
jgi:tetratricopeptide (TPR) repeat protein